MAGDRNERFARTRRCTSLLQEVPDWNFVGRVRGHRLHIERGDLLGILEHPNPDRDGAQRGRFEV
jgi:hypothetical protein